MSRSTVLARLVSLGLVIVLVGGACSSTDDNGSQAEEPAPPTPTPMPTPTVEPSAAEATTTAFDWPTGTPASEGFNVAALVAGVDFVGAQDSNLHSLTVVRRGTLVVDARIFPYVDDAPHDLASVTKSVTSLVVGAAIARGDLEGLDQPLGELLPQTADQPVGAVTIAELLGMRTGLDCGLEPGEPELRAMLEQADFVASAARLPRQGAAGEQFAYCSPGYHLVSAAVTAATGVALADYADEVLFGPLGIEDWSWPDDPAGISRGWGDLRLGPTDLARIGQLVIDGGTWQGTELIPSAYVDRLSADPLPAGGGFDYGLGWWLPGDALDGALMAVGRGGQFLLVWPEFELVVTGTAAGSDGVSIAGFVAGAFGEEPVAEDPDLQAQLDAAVRALAEPPAPQPPTAAGPGAVLDQRLALEPNPLRVEQIELSAASVSEATMTVVVAGREYPMLLGLDGVPRVTEETPVDAPLASLGEWSGTSLRVDVEQVNGPNHWLFVLDLDETPGLEVTDLTGLFPSFAVAGTPVAESD